MNNQAFQIPIFKLGINCTFFLAYFRRLLIRTFTLPNALPACKEPRESFYQYLGDAYRHCNILNTSLR